MEDALDAYTVNAAYAGFAEDRKGKLTPGYLADLVVLSDDLFRIEPQTIRDVQVLRTMVGGRWVFEAGTLTP